MQARPGGHALQEASQPIGVLKVLRYGAVGTVRCGRYGTQRHPIVGPRDSTVCLSVCMEQQSSLRYWHCFFLGTYCTVLDRAGQDRTGRGGSCLFRLSAG